MSDNINKDSAVAENADEVRVPEPAAEACEEKPMPDRAEILIPREVSENNPMHVKLGIYDGPLDLLLELIRKNEMDIRDIEISVITRQYLGYLAEMRKLDLEIAGEFLVIAATLIYIKSKMLLPDDTVEEEDDGEDPREELVRKLMEYQAFKEAARELGFLESEHSKVFSRQIADYYLLDQDTEDEQIEAFSANLFDLLSAFQKVLTHKGREAMHEVFEEVVSIEEKIAELRARLLNKPRILFSELFSVRATRNELIATFLALLEVVKSRCALVTQEKQFGDIVIEKTEQVVNSGEVE